MSKEAPGADRDTQRRLLEAAIAIIDESGHAGLRIRDVAERVGVAVTSIYHFYGDRNGLVDEADAERYRRSFFGPRSSSPTIWRAARRAPTCGRSCSGPSPATPNTRVSSGDESARRCSGGP